MALYFNAGVYLLGVFIWPFIDPVTPLEPSEAHDNAELACGKTG